MTWLFIQNKKLLRLILIEIDEQLYVVHCDSFIDFFLPYISTSHTHAQNIFPIMNFLESPKPD
jgi:hypothetical protein